jgi:hypothetical protein
VAFSEVQDEATEQFVSFVENGLVLSPDEVACSSEKITHNKLEGREIEDGKPKLPRTFATGLFITRQLLSCQRDVWKEQFEISNAQRRMEGHYVPTIVGTRFDSPGIMAMFQDMVAEELLTVAILKSFIWVPLDRKRMEMTTSPTLKSYTYRMIGSTTPNNSFGKKVRSEILRQLIEPVRLYYERDRCIELGPGDLDSGNPVTTILDDVDNCYHLHSFLTEAFGKHRLLKSVFFKQGGDDALVAVASPNYRDVTKVKESYENSHGMKWTPWKPAKILVVPLTKLVDFLNGGEVAGVSIYHMNFDDFVNIYGMVPCFVSETTGHIIGAFPIYNWRKIMCSAWQPANQAPNWIDVDANCATDRPMTMSEYTSLRVLGINQIIGMFVPLNGVLESLFKLNPISLKSPKDLTTMIPMYEGAVDQTFAHFRNSLEVLKMWSPEVHNALIELGDVEVPAPKMDVAKEVKISDDNPYLSWDDFDSYDPDAAWSDQVPSYREKEAKVSKKLQGKSPVEVSDSGLISKSAKQTKLDAAARSKGIEVPRREVEDDPEFHPPDEFMEIALATLDFIKDGSMPNWNLSVGDKKHKDVPVIKRVIGDLTLLRYPDDDYRIYVPDLRATTFIQICIAKTKSEETKEQALTCLKLINSTYFHFEDRDELSLGRRVYLAAALWKLAGDFVIPKPVLPHAVVTRELEDTSSEAINFLAWYSHEVIDLHHTYRETQPPAIVRSAYAKYAGINPDMVPKINYRQLQLSKPVVVLKTVRVGCLSSSPDVPIYALVLPHDNNKVVYMGGATKAVVTYVVRQERVMNILGVKSVKSVAFVLKKGLTSAVKYDHKFDNFEEFLSFVEDGMSWTPQFMQADHWRALRENFLALTKKRKNDAVNKKRPAQHQSKPIKKIGHRQKRGGKRIANLDDE